MGTGIIGWIIIGGIVGWLAGIIMNDRESILINIVVGIVGAGIAGWLFGQSFHQNGLNVYSFVGSLIGAVILLAIVNLVRRGRVR